MPSRASYERAVADAILDEAMVSHVGTVAPAGHPVVIPTLHARDGDWLYIHGSAASTTLRRAGQVETCLTATLIDGLVLARSAVHHSVNYRSVVVFGQAEPVAGEAGKCAALEAFTEKLVPGRWGDARLPTAQELKGTAVLRLPLAEASAKLRTGGPLDDEDDYALPVWAGTIDLRSTFDPPQPDERLPPTIPCPSYLSELTRPGAQRLSRQG
ncbi:MAG TPA: pyridoxamine 5'-phosphate oxidase family protein [Solirubrobacterales bacterium]|nr:pyridoxamine 5'-phosphate oxidase family protein [Solirubrobacterales bacterium]